MCAKGLREGGVWKAYLRADDRGRGAGLARVMAGLVRRRLVEVVLVERRGPEKAAGDVGGPGGVGRGSWRRSRGATVSGGGGGGRLVIHGRERLMVCGGQGEGAGAWRGGGGREQVRLLQVGAVGGVVVVVVVRMRVVVVVVVVLVVGGARVSRRLPRRGLRVAAGDEVSVLELGGARLLRRQLELDEHHVIADAQRQGEGGAARQEVVDLRAEKRDIFSRRIQKAAQTHTAAFSAPSSQHTNTHTPH